MQMRKILTEKHAIKGEREDRSKKVGSLPYIWKRICKNPGAMMGIILLCLIVLMSILAPFILKYDYMTVNLANKFALPSWEHPFGCDELGRDIMARVFVGARYTLSIGVGAVAISTTLGILIGAVSGYFGGKIDSILMRILDVIQAFPALVLAIAISTALGQGIANCIYAIGLAYMPTFARLMRANILSIRGSEFIEAATAINCSTSRIIFKHVIPNTISPLIVQVSMSLANAGLSAAAMSFLGLGVREPYPEWGTMISSARTFIRDYPHMVIIPGLFIMISVLSFNLIGDSVRDALDPKMRD